VSTSGKVGSKIGILGQGFSASSVVKFNGVTATTVTRTGSTFLLATVPAGASDGYVTVTTGATTLTSSKKFTVHDSWSSGTVMPTARFGAFTGAIGTNIYVIGGATNSGYQVTGVNEIYNTATNKWTTGASDPNPRELGASAVVNGILYVIGGSTSGSNPVNLLEAYNPVNNKWTTKSPMPTARNSMPAIVEKNIIYVIGGYDPNTGVFYDNVESYNPATDTWTAEAPLPVATAWEAVGLLGTTIVAADGETGPSGTIVGSNEGYNVTTNTWSTLTADPTPRVEACFAAVNGQLYVAGGANTTGVLGINEGYNPTTKAWRTLTPMPHTLATAGSATVGGRLFCFGGASSNLSSVYNYVQIYQP
jgi:N-acetylneuraminic acid mutarotase